MFKCMSMLFSPTDPPGAKSVDELISASILPVFGHPEYKFSSGGREDKDVRMLGSGRSVGTCNLHTELREPLHNLALIAYFCASCLAHPSETTLIVLSHSNF
eukprot:SAG31_NODE_271_length_18717_cov_8.685949_7_plen_102_part_00